MFFRENEEWEPADGQNVSCLHYLKWMATPTAEQVTVVSHAGAPSSVMLPRPSAHPLAVQARGYVSSVFQGYGDKLQTKEVAVCSLTNVVSLINSVSATLLT